MRWRASLCPFSWWVDWLYIFLTNRHNCVNRHWAKDIRRAWNSESSLLKDQKNLGEQCKWKKDLWDSGFSSPEDSLMWNGWKAWGRHLNRTNGKRRGSRDSVKHPSQHSVFSFPALGFFPPQRQLFLAPLILVWSSVFYSLLMLSNTPGERQQPSYNSQLHSSPANNISWIRWHVIMVTHNFAC